MRRPYIPVATERLVRERAKHRCEYCQSPAQITSAPFCLDHIHPHALGGASTQENLALSCPFCNSSKGDRTAAIEVQSGETVTLFHPRTQIWSEHFEWSDDGLMILARTPIGLVTIAALGLNRIELCNLRRALIRFGVHPPTND